MGSRSKTVHVIDDDAGFRKSIVVLLGKFGFVVRFHPSAEAFLSSLNSAPVNADCIVLDIHLGGMSGIELSKRLSQMGSAAPIIFITANDTAGFRDAVARQGCVAYLCKPFTGKALMDALDQALA